MALDQFMEKINLWAKVLVNGELTGERISAVVPSLNYVLSMEEAYRSATGRKEAVAEDHALGIDYGPDVDRVFRSIMGQQLQSHYESTFLSNLNHLSGKQRGQERFVPDFVIQENDDILEYYDEQLQKLRKPQNLWKLQSFWSF